MKKSWGKCHSSQLSVSYTLYVGWLWAKGTAACVCAGGPMATTEKEHHCLSQFGLLEQKYHKLGRLQNNRNVLPTALAAGSPRSRCRQIQGLMRAAFSPCPHVGERRRELCEVSFIKAPSSLMTALPSWPIHFPKAPPPNTSTLGIRTLTYKFCGEANIQSIALKMSILHTLVHKCNVIPIKNSKHKFLEINKIIKLIWKEKWVTSEMFWSKERVINGW